ncbi:MAG: PASTA domain-containing protein [Polyangiaceae bacterium]|nr:PASTA domain-containing protein [Polyangiaceae bacterium]
MNASTVILIALVTSVVTTVGTVYVVERYDIVPHAAPSAPETVVPNFVGQMEADARSNAAAANLTIAVSSQEATDDLKPGTVLRQSLPAGQRVSPQQTIDVVLAQALPKVPTLTGLSVEAATERLKEAGYFAQFAGTVADAKIAAGLVARQLPSADAAYVKGAAITLQLSGGPADVEMPKLLGRPYVEATKAVEALGLKPVVGWISEGETPAYVILQQTPAAGEKVEPGGVVRFVVNR